MNNITVGLLMLIGTVSAAYTDLPKQLEEIFTKAVSETQLVVTAGDMKSLSTMLDATYIMDRYLPSEEEFQRWVNQSFKENNVKSLMDDHWGNPYIYKLKAKGRKYILISTGPDGRPGTSDDLTISGP